MVKKIAGTYGEKNSLHVPYQKWRGLPGVRKVALFVESLDKIQLFFEELIYDILFPPIYTPEAILHT